MRSPLQTTASDQQYGSSASLLDYVFKHQVEGIKPKSVVDFGAGGGKNGRLIREMIGKSCRIIAVEGCERTVEMLSEKGLYDDVQHELLQTWIQRNSQHYELAVFGDVLEHIAPNGIHRAIEKCCSQFDHIIIVAPLHEIFQEEVYGNALELHLTYLTDRFFDRYTPVEKHIAHGADWTIMNVHIVSKPRVDPLYRRVSWAVFHRCVLLLQPLGLARPFVSLLKRFCHRYKWLLRD